MRFLEMIPKQLHLTFLCLFATSVSAQQESDSWEYRLSPYLWLPTINGTLNYELPPGGGGSPGFSVGPTDWLDLLNFGLLLSGSAQKGKFVVFSDLVYLSMTSKNAGSIDGVRIGPDFVPIEAGVVLNTRTDLDALNVTLGLGREISRSESGRASVFAGIRYLGIDLSSQWDLTASITGPNDTIVLPSQGSIGQDVDLLDGIVGFRGEFGKEAGRWSFPYYFDVGTGDSDLTWNAMAGAARRFGWGDLLLVFRHLEYDQGDDGLLQDFRFSGPVVGARFRF